MSSSLPQNTDAAPYTAPAKLLQQSVLTLPLHPITLKFEDVAYKIKVGRRRGFSWNGTWNSKEETILNGMTGMVCPGEILAMLGPSGSGKTTLLTALGGRLNGKLSGKITYNGQPFSSHVRRRIGFVAQNDVLYPHLTVAETLIFTSLLRLPDSLTKEEKVEHAEHVINELGLNRCRNSMIGGPLFRGISGGERKRVSIGQEMLIKPSLLLLDEPTSGLDSTTAQRILTTIKHLASGGRTVVITIHQPSSRLYHMFNKVVLLSEGCPIYHGPASTALDYFSSLGFSTSDTVNPADLLLDLANGVRGIAGVAPDLKRAAEEQGGEFRQEGGGSTENEQKIVREVLVSAYEKNIATRLKAELRGVITVSNNLRCASATTTDAHKWNVARSEEWGTSWWGQFTVLLRRGLKERRYEAFNRLRIFQVISVALLAGLLWWHSPASHVQDRLGLLFFFSVFWGFFPLYNAVFTFPQERAMLIKERSSGMYRLSSYFLARTAGDLPMELALPTAFVVIIYWMSGLKPDPTTFILSLLIVLFSVLVSQSLGLAIGALLMDVKQATTLASVTTLVFLMAGGYYIQRIPPFILWLKYLSFSFYCYRLLLGVQFTDEDYYECSHEKFCRVVDFPAVKAVGVKHLWTDVCAMALMLVGYRIIAYLLLHRVRVR